MSIPSGKTKKTLNFEIIGSSERHIKLRHLKPNFTHIKMQLESQFPLADVIGSKAQNQSLSLELWLEGRDGKAGMLLTNVGPGQYSSIRWIANTCNVEKVVRNLKKMVVHMAKSPTIAGFSMEDIKMWAEKEPTAHLPLKLVNKITDAQVVMPGDEVKAEMNGNEGDDDLLSEDWHDSDSESDYFAEMGEAR